MKGITIIGCILFSVLMAGSVFADTQTFDLNKGSTLPDADYGSVTLTLNAAGGIDIKVDLTESNAKIVNTGFAYSFAFNMADSDLAINVSGLPATYSLVNSGNPSAGGMDGFGSFEYGVIFNAQGGGAGTDSVLQFTVNRVGGFTTVGQLVEDSVHPPGEIDSPFAVDVIQGITNGRTGVIGTGDDGENGHAPEPATLLLLGSGLAGAGLYRRLRKPKG